MVIHSVDKKLITLVFIFFYLINIESSGGHLDWWDGMEAFFVTESMVLKHTAKLDPTIPSVAKSHFDIRYTVHTNKMIATGKNYDKNTMPLEPVYTVRSLMLSAIAVPFYFAALLFSVSPIAVIGLFVNSLFISLTCVVIFCFALDLYRSKKIALAVSLIFALCSFVWPYNTTFWVQPLQALVLIASSFFMYKSLHYNSSYICHYTLSKDYKKKGYYLAAVGGLFLGLSVFAHPTSVILIPGFLAYFIVAQRNNNNLKSIVYFLALLGVILFFVGLVNYLRFGSFTEFGYGYFASLSTHDGWRGLVGLIASPGAGLIFFFPLAILLPLGVKYMYQKNKALILLFAFIIILTWLDIGTLSFNFEPLAWSGGVAWGPRYFITILPFITLILASILTNLRKRLFLKTLVISLCIAGFIINLAGTLVWYQYGIMYGWEKEHLSKLGNSLDIMTWQPYYSPIILHFKALKDNYVSQIQPEKFITTQWYWIAFGLAPCSYDDYIFCKFGLTSLLVIVAIISVTAFFLMLEIGLLKKPIFKRFKILAF